MPPIDLSGEWVGFYRQYDQRRSIRATLRQQGNLLTGSMQDLETEWRQSLSESVFYAGLPPGADEQLDAQLRALHPADPNAPIVTVSRVPSQSLLKGELRGTLVRFVKSYQGESFAGFQVGDKQIGKPNTDHSVDYQGTVKESGNRIEGLWSIVDPANPRNVARDAFQLDRVP